MWRPLPAPAPDPANAADAARDFSNASNGGKWSTMGMRRSVTCTCGDCSGDRTRSTALMTPSWFSPPRARRLESPNTATVNGTSQCVSSASCVPGQASAV